MATSQPPRIAVVTRETRLKDLLKRWATKGQVLYRFRAARVDAAIQMNRLTQAAAIPASPEDPDFEDLEAEDKTYEGTLAQLARDLEFGMPVQVIDRQFVPTFDFSMCAAVVVAGQDGLVANTAKYVGGIPIVGVNPDPA